MTIYQLEKIETPRLLIRPVQLGDQFAINRAMQASLPALQRWMPWSKDPCLSTTEAFVEQAVRDWQDGQAHEYPMTVIYKPDNAIICASGFNEMSQPDKGVYEIGYWIHAGYQGLGLITECVTALTRYALTALEANSVQICTQVDNDKSVAVARRCGFDLTAMLTNHRVDCVSGEPADSYLFACETASSLPAIDVRWL